MRQRTMRHIGTRAKRKKDNGPHEQRCTKAKEHKNKGKHVQRGARTKKQKGNGSHEQSGKVEQWKIKSCENRRKAVRHGGNKNNREKGRRPQ